MLPIVNDLLVAIPPKVVIPPKVGICWLSSRRRSGSAGCHPAEGRDLLVVIPPKVGIHGRRSDDVAPASQE
jgi:hypothetical protein